MIRNLRPHPVNFSSLLLLCCWRAMGMNPHANHINHPSSGLSWDCSLCFRATTVSTCLQWLHSSSKEAGFNTMSSWLNCLETKRTRVISQLKKPASVGRHAPVTRHLFCDHMGKAETESTSRRTADALNRFSLHTTVALEYFSIANLSPLLLHCPS